MKKIAYIAVVALAVVACNKEEGAKIDSIKVVPETKTLYTDEALPELAVGLDHRRMDFKRPGTRDCVSKGRTRTDC